MLGGNWTEPTNWEPNQVPGPNDKVRLTLPGTYELVLSETTTNKGLTLGNSSGVQTLVVAGGSLTVNGDSTIENGGVLDLTDGTITGPGIMTVSSRMVWRGGKVTARVTTTSAATLQLVGDVERTLDGATLDNSGTILWEAGGWWWSNGASVVNRGTFDLLHDLPLQQGAGAASQLINSGTLRKVLGTSGTTFEGINLHHRGTIQLTSAPLRLLGGTHTLTNNCRLTGAYSLLVEGTTLDVSGTVLNDPPLGFQSGVMRGSATLNGGLNWQSGAITGNLTVKGPIDWSGGELTGVLTVAATSQLTTQNGGAKRIAGGILHQLGTAQLNSDQAVEVSSGSSINNSGLLILSTGAGLTYTGGTRPWLFNTGTMRKTSEGLTTFDEIELRHKGRLEINAGSFVLAGNTHSLTNGSRLTGTGPLVIGSGAFVSVQGVISNDVPIRLEGGELTGSATLRGPLEFRSGRISARLTLAGSNYWSGGELTGTILIPAATVLELQPGLDKTIVGGRLSNQGTLALASETLGCAQGAILTNSGLAEFNSESPVRQLSGAPALVINSGTWRKTSGAAQTDFGGVDVRNSGLIDAGASVLNLAAGTVTLNAGSQLQGSNRWIVDGATVILSGTITSPLPLRLLSGSISGSATFNGPFYWEGGTLLGQLTLSGTTEWAGGILAGSMNVPSGRTLNVLAGSLKRIDGGFLTNSGTMTLATTENIQGDNGAVIVNRGTFTSGSEEPLLSALGARPLLLNQGRFVKTGPGPMIFHSADLMNSGPIDVQAGALNFTAGNHRFQFGSTFTGAGSNVLNGANISLTGWITNTIPWHLQAGTLTATGTLHGPLVWAGGTITGILTNRSTGTWEITGPARKTLSAGTIYQQGTARFNGEGSLICDHASQIVNSGLFEVNTSAAVGQIAGATSTFNNTGTLRKLDATTNSFSGLSVQNRGAIDLRAGAFRFSGGSHGFHNASRVDGIGKLEVAGGTLSITGTVVAVPGIRLSSGLLSANGTLSGPLVWTGGQLSGQLAADSMVQWSGGDLLGSLTPRSGMEWRGGKVKGALTIPASQRLELALPVVQARGVDGGSLTNAGTMVIPLGSALALDNGAKFINTGLLETSDNDSFTSTQGARSLLHNRGTWRQLSSGVMAWNGVELRNAGILELQGTISFTGQTHSFDSGTLIRGPGQLRVGGGTLSLHSSVSISNRFEIVAGTLAGPGTMRGLVDWKGGTIAGGLTFAFPSTLQVTENNDKFVDGSTINLLSTATISSQAHLQLKNGAVVINRGTLDSSASQPFVVSGTGTRSIFEQRGTFIKLSGGALDFNSVKLVNSGTINVNKGTVDLTGNTHSLENGSQLIGSGSLRISGAIVSLSGTVTTLQPLQLLSGEINDKGSLQGPLTWSGGTIAGELTAHSSVSWQGGTLRGLLTVGTNAVLTASGNSAKQITRGTLQVDGSAIMNAGSSLQCEDSGAIRNYGQFILPPTFVFSHAVNGYLEFMNAGALVMTNGPGIVSANLNYRQTSSGRLLIDIHGASPGTNLAQLRIGQTATLAGKLTSYLRGGFSPAKSNRFEIITARTVSSKFTSLAGDMDRMSPVYTSTNVILECLPPAIVTPPLDTSVVLAHDTTLDVAMTGTTPMRYQWFFEGAPLPAETNAQLQINIAALSQMGNYHVFITNFWGQVTSPTAYLTVNVPVTIVQHPTSRTVIDGNSTTFNVSATGTIPLRYQWKLNGSSLTGKTNDTLTLTDIQSAAAGNYSVEVRNVVGPVQSANATLTVYVRPTISEQPSDVNVIVGDKTDFMVKVAGTSPYFFQWYRNGLLLPGETRAKITFSDATPEQAGGYSVLVTNIAGSIWSRAARLTVNEPVVIRTHPRSVGVLEGQQAIFTVVAEGTGPLRYRWLFNGGFIAGATNGSWMIPQVGGTNAGRYSVEVSNLLGSRTSSEATLTIQVPPFIVTQPVAKSVNRGSYVSLSVVAGGTSPFGYQWFRNELPLVEGTSATLSISDAKPADEGLYKVVVTNLVGSVTSSLARIALNYAPIITSQPPDLEVSVGGDATFSVQAHGRPEPTYQWRLNGVNIPQATNATFVITNVQGRHQGSYAVSVANSVGTISSRAAQLKVSVPTLPFADDFGDGSYVFSASAVGKGFNTNATHEAGEPDHDKKKWMRTSVWLRWWAPANGIATFTTAGSDFDTVLAVYTGDTMNNLRSITSDDDSGGFHNSKVSFNAKAGFLYHIVVDGYKGASGQIILGWDMIETSEQLPEIVSAPADQTANTNATIMLQVDFDAFEPTQVQWFFEGVALPGATQNALTLSSLQPSQVGSYYVRLTASSGRTVVSRAANIQINGNGYTTVASRNKLIEAADFALIESTPFVPSRLMGGGGGGGGAGLSRGYSGTQIFSTVGADNDPGEPFHCGLTGGASSWFVYRPAIDGMLILDTEGSSFDTVLAVYVSTGDGFDGLQSIACDNDSGADGRDSKVMFSASSTTVYYIAVDGVGGTSGQVVLHYSIIVPPVIIVHPASQSVFPGEPVQLQVAAEGNPKLAYQWRRNGLTIPGATNSLFTLPSFDGAAGGTYDVTVENLAGTVDSEPAVLYPDAPTRLMNCAPTADGCFKMRVVGRPGETFTIDRSDDLLLWVPVATSTSATGVWDFMEAIGGGAPRRYYRVRQ